LFLGARGASNTRGWFTEPGTIRLGVFEMALALAALTAGNCRVLITDSQIQGEVRVHLPIVIGVPVDRLLITVIVIEPALRSPKLSGEKSSRKSWVEL